MTFKSKLYGGLSALWAVFIYANSFKIGTQSEGVSSAISTKIAEWLLMVNVSVEIDLIHLSIRKTAHFGEFFILGLLITLCFAALGKKLSVYYWNILFLCLASGVIDEFIQSFVIGRSGDVRDVVLDFCGALLGFLLVVLFSKKTAKHNYTNRRFR